MAFVHCMHEGVGMTMSAKARSNDRLWLKAAVLDTATKGPLVTRCRHPIRWNPPQLNVARDGGNSGN